MGMYDDMHNGWQVKCFPIAIWNHNALDFFESGGLLRYFKIGDDVPYQSFLYKYGKNTLIIDSSDYEQNDSAAIHVIRNGKYVKCIENEDVFALKRMPVANACIINRWGEQLKNINNISDLIEYIRLAKSTYHDVLACLAKPADKEIREKYFEALRNRNLYTDEEFNALKRVYDAEELRNYAEIDKIRSGIKQRFKVTYDTVELDTFGGYLECLCDENVPSKEKKEIIKAARDFIKKHPEIKDKYIEYAKDGPQSFIDNVNRAVAML